MKLPFAALALGLLALAGSSSAQQSSAPAPPSAAAASPTVETGKLATDAERNALTYTHYDLELHLDPAQQSLSGRARIMVRNDSAAPLSHLPVQISSALHWDAISIAGANAHFATERIDSDIDHTGELTEAVVPLAQPLAPGASLSLELFYSGDIRQSSARLVRLGAPADIAASSEWDAVNTPVTALRGFGNVIWFPVSAAPVLLGEGARLFDEIGKWKLREQTAALSMRISVEYTSDRPTAAFLNGHVIPAPPEADPLKVPAAGVPQAITFTLPRTTVGFAPLSLFVVDAPVQKFPGVEIYGSDPAVAAAYNTIAQTDVPLVQQALGRRQERPMVLAALPQAGDLPFETANILLLPLQPAPATDSTAPVLAHMLSHSYFVSPRPWLDEGVAQWITLLWIEQRAGRAAAIAQMDSRRAALAIAETTDPGVNPGQSLIGAWSDIYYRDKAADVLWMLRDMTSPHAMMLALSQYRAAQDREPSYLQRLLDKASGKDLEWFFDDWVYRDRGLPDLHINNAYSHPILAKNGTGLSYLVSVEVRNDSFCSAEVPVTAEGDTTRRSGRLLIPAHGQASLRLLIDSHPARVLVNDGSVPEVRTSHHEHAIEPAR